MKMSFFSESAKASPLERRMAARAGAAAGKPLDEDIQKNRSGGGIHQHPKISGFGFRQRHFREQVRFV
jgi:hypothetical protein